MNATMDDFDAIKSALQGIDARLAQRHALDLRQQRRSGITRIQWGLWPLWFGQTVQMLFGLLCIALGVAVWTHLRDDGALFFSALAVHVHGIACIVMGGITLGKLAGIDRGASLLDTQTRLAKLRRIYVIGGMTVGLAWWLFWMPFMATLFFWLSGGRANLYANIGGMTTAIMVGVGIAGLIGTWWFHRWSRSPQRPKLAKAMDDAVTGHSMAKAQRRLDELKAFGED